MFFSFLTILSYYLAEFCYLSTLFADIIILNAGDIYKTSPKINTLGGSKNE